MNTGTKRTAYQQNVLAPLAYYRTYRKQEEIFNLMRERYGIKWPRLYFDMATAILYENKPMSKSQAFDLRCPGGTYSYTMDEYVLKGWFTKTGSKYSLTPSGTVILNEFLSLLRASIKEADAIIEK